MGIDQSKSQGKPVLAGAIRRVLLVDDSRVQRRILSASLERSGYEVFEAESGVDALEICKSAQPDLILSDWMMPGMNGLELCRAFRQLEQESYGYFILLTSKSNKEEIALGFESGADDFLTKPVNAQELRARITAGERILRMQRELTDKNQMISETLAELQSVYDSLDHDLIEAKKLQQSLVRDRFQAFGPMTVSLILRSCGHVGGDLVGHFRISDDKVGLYSIDVSGHGISSALMTARLAGYLSSAAPDQNVALQKRDDGTYGLLPPEEVVGQLNQLILNEMETEHYFTMILAVVDTDTGKVDLCQAGHPHPLVQRRDGEITQTGPGGLPVGLIPGAQYSQFSLDLNPGDRLLILSDGVTECVDPSEEMLGEEGLSQLMQRLHDVKGEALFEMLLWELSEFAGGRGFRDDVSGILLEYETPESESEQERGEEPVT